MDSRIRCLTETEGKLFLTQDGSIGLLLKNLIPASMKKVEYHAFAAFTSKDLLACKCSCKCGGEGDEAIVCVHILPLIFLLSLLLTEGLAENILLELCARFQVSNEQQMDEQMKEKMKKYMNILMLASGEEKGVDMNASICNILSGFQVGTEKRKNTIVGAPDPSLIGSIMNLPNLMLVSTEQSAMLRMKRIAAKSDTSKAVENNPHAVVSKRFSFTENDEGDAFGSFASIPCQMCNSGILTNHRCEICGLAFCILCTEKWGTSENRVRCGPHVDVIIMGEQDEDLNMEHTTSSSSSRGDDEKEFPKYACFDPDYVRVSMMIELLQSKDNGKKK